MKSPFRYKNSLSFNSTQGISTLSNTQSLKNVFLSGRAFPYRPSQVVSPGFKTTFPYFQVMNSPNQVSLLAVFLLNCEILHFLYPENPVGNPCVCATRHQPSQGGWGGVGILNKVLYGEVPSRGPTRYPCIYFNRKGTLPYNSYWQMVSLSPI